MVLAILSFPRAIPRVVTALGRTLDRFASDLIRVEKNRLNRKEHPLPMYPHRTSIPEEDIKYLLTATKTLEDVWSFFMKRLKSGSSIDFLCLSVLDESGDFVRIQFIHPEHSENPLDGPILSMSERSNHLIQAYQRKDTTFTSRWQDLGTTIEPYLPSEITDQQSLNLFSIPFIAGNRTIALITIGFQEVDAFSQAKLSYLYQLRDQIAQLVWNLTLQDRMKNQVQVDNMTGLLTYSYFQRVLEQEVEKAQSAGSSISAMILDINNIQDLNDSLGHSVGDEAICYLASSVRRCIRGVDTVARYGGDEVVVLLPDADTQIADEIAERFIHSFRDHLPPHLSHLSISLGYATYPDETRQSMGLLKLADQALHLAKFKGSKTGESIAVASREVNRLNEKTVLEVFASHVAKKYNSHKLYNELIRRIEHPSEANTEAPTTEHLMLETIGSLAGALDAKDKYTRGHSQVVANYSVALAHALKLSAEEVEQIRLAAFLHDIGKIGIPESILCKAGPLNEKEWEIMKQHPVIGARQILAPVTALKGVIPMVEFHHENWDGTGYPSGLSGEEIPLGARIVSIVDAFHGLTSDRSYRKALPITEAAHIIQSGAGSKWDPSLVEKFIKILNVVSPKIQETTILQETTQEAPLGQLSLVASKSA